MLDQLSQNPNNISADLTRLDQHTTDISASLTMLDQLSKNPKNNSADLTRLDQAF
jgi:uncharacterized protein Smg (DUF494 family)